MSTRGHVVASLLLCVLFAAYGMQAMTIPLFPGQELEPFKPRTMPLALTCAGLLLCAVRIVQLLRNRETEPGMSLAAFSWWPAAFLCGVMIAYGFLLSPLGFVASTSLFLATGFLILGERRFGILLSLPLTFSLAFYFLMTRALGLYLSPGSWWVF